MSRPPRPLPPRALPSRPLFPPPPPRAPASVEVLDDLDLVEEVEAVSVIAADETGEIAIDDILEVNPLTTERMAPARPLVTEPLRVQPSSLAPLALDVAPTSARATLPSWTPNATSTLQMARAAGIPKLPPRVVVAATSVLGLCLVAALGGAVLGFTRPVAPGSAAGSSPSVGQVPRTAVLESARALVTDPPDTAPGKDPSSTDDAPDAGAAPSRPSAPAPAPARAATGVVRVPGSAPGVLVDGAPRKASGGSVTVACGKHMVKVPGHAARSVVVPCGGAATF